MKKTGQEFILAVLFITAILVIIEYILHNFYISRFASVYAIFDTFSIYGRMFLRFLLIALFIGFNFITPSARLSKKIGNDKNRKNIIRVLAILLNLAVIIGYINFRPYDIIAIPFFIGAAFRFNALSAATFSRNLSDDASIFGVSGKKDSYFHLEYKTDKGILRIHKPHMNIFREGKPGTGKSNLFKQDIVQYIERGLPAFVYDYKGDFRKGDEPELSKVAYSAYVKHREMNPASKLRFYVINFTSPEHSNRINVFSEKYISDKTDIENSAQVLFDSLKSKDSKDDFWSQYGKVYISSILYMLFKNKDKGIFTIPHAITVLSSDYIRVIKWLDTDPDVAENASSLIGAYKAGAIQTLASAAVTASVPFAKMNDPFIFWVLSGDDCTLTVNNTESPAVLCICNAQSKAKALTPIISLIAETAMKEVNVAGRERMLFQLDELTTLRLPSFPDFSSTARGRMVNCSIGIQSKARMKDEFKSDMSDAIMSNFSNYMIFGCGTETAKTFSDFFGEEYVVKEGYSKQEGEHHSVTHSENMVKQKRFEQWQIAGQEIGQAVGQIGDGKPPYFSARFSEFKYDMKDIPPFAFPVKLSENPDKEDISRQREIMNMHIEKNYRKIKQDITEILAEFEPDEEEQNKN